MGKKGMNHWNYDPVQVGTEIQQIGWRWELADLHRWQTPVKYEVNSQSEIKNGGEKMGSFK